MGALLAAVSLSEMTVIKQIKASCSAFQAPSASISESVIQGRNPRQGHANRCVGERKKRQL